MTKVILVERNEKKQYMTEEQYNTLPLLARREFKKLDEKEL